MAEFPATTGAARKARERPARAQAKHVLLLSNNWQTLAVHHTSAANKQRPASDVDEIAELRRELQALRNEVAVLRATIPVVQPPMKNEATGIPKAKQQVQQQSEAVDPGSVGDGRVPAGTAKAPAEKRQRTESGLEQLRQNPEQEFRVDDRVVAATDKFMKNGKVAGMRLKNTIGTVLPWKSSTPVGVVRVRFETESAVWEGPPNLLRLWESG